MKKQNVVLGSAALAAAAAAAGVGVGVAVAVWRNRRKMSFHGKVVLITGGSRGLGLALAHEFAQQGAKLMLCARDAGELAAAQLDLAKPGVEVSTMVCDVTDRRQVSELIDTTLRKYGQIDALVNNAGLIQVGPIDAMTLEDFESAMNVMFWGPVYTTLAVAPHMRERCAGRIVNITSVGAKVSVPHLIPYSCAKFAAAAFSEGMRAEFQGSGVKVVTIAPGLMRTGSHLNALFKGSENGEAAWFSLGASMPGISMSAKQAARQIVEATAKGRAERILSLPANFISHFHGLFPGATADLLGLVNRVLPHGTKRTSTRGADTRALNSPWFQALTILGKRAAERYLQPGVAH
jgi:short-subunit dehydrogenase